MGTQTTETRVATAAIRGCKAVDAEVGIRPDRRAQRLAIDGMSEAAEAETRWRVEAALERAGARGAGDRMLATVEPGDSMGRPDLWDLPIAIGGAGRSRSNPASRQRPDRRSAGEETATPNASGER